MTKKNNVTLLIVLIFLAVVFLKTQTSFLGAVLPLDTKLVQFTNEPIEARLQLTNLTGAPEFEVTHNGVNLETFNLGDVNGTYVVNADVSTKGLFKVLVYDSVTVGNDTTRTLAGTLTIEVEQPFISVTADFPPSVDKKETIELKVKTRTPQGDLIDVDKVEIEYADPMNVKKTFEMERDSEGTYTKDFEFKKEGSYIFKVYARKSGFITKEHAVPVNVLGFSDIPFILYILIGVVALFILLVLRKRYWKK